ncbi:TMEM175 family protein [Chiayiivirga flava]|uniref:Putative membrane protein n=1 Tax=Chiayiivirga flava TaxID=659595 RepID=A0A7W8D765_9GAMM|nr:TMEM175 family protein [Chiayiivirga flava]MBB5208050.1 putative membrane protein [Chiayiivirga flava]
MDDLASRPAFRLRGAQITRLETFVDAAFAFAATMLVIAFDALPQTFAELYDALRRVPTFVLCFALLMLFWLAHNRWSRRFGLEDTWSTLLSLALVLIVMIYMYPLRMIISGALHLFSGGWVPEELAFTPGGEAIELQLAFMVYSVGFGLLALLVVLLNRHALRHAETLALSPYERAETRTEIGVHGIMAASAVLSVAVSAGFLLGTSGGDRMQWYHALPMWVYCLLSIAIPVYAVRRDRLKHGLSAADARPAPEP